jgi:hypothetical protein
MNNSRKLYHYAVDTFVDLLSQLRGRKIRYRCSNTDFANWDYFAHQYQTVNIGEDYIRKFIEFGLNYWFIEGNRDVKLDKCLFLNIFNKAMIKRWNNLHPAISAKIVRDNLKQEFDIKIHHKSLIPELILEVREAEETAKDKYHNTNRGLAWCIANTSLYFHKSSLCASCKFKNECKDELKRQYPKIYKKRGY